jgi:NADH:ubiquinone oxidoreductase subunit 6 (subunit J)
MENLLSPPLLYFLIVWSVVTLLWLALLVYRGVMQNREEDQLFITGGHEQMAADQSVLISKVTKLGKPIWALGIVSVVLLVAMIGIWMWMGLQQSGR